MSRLIDMDALIMRLGEYFDKREKEVKYGSCVIHATWTDVIYHIRTSPTIDAVEVVRCKDCKHLKLTGGNESTGEGVYTCDVWKRRTFKGNGFCSYAERRSDEKY